MSECTGWEVEAADCIPTLCQEAEGSWHVTRSLQIHRASSQGASTCRAALTSYLGSAVPAPSELPTQHEADSHPSCSCLEQCLVQGRLGLLETLAHPISKVAENRSRKGAEGNLLCAGWVVTELSSG